MSDLIERLRALSRHEHDDLSIGDEAAYEIESLLDEVKSYDDLLGKLRGILNDTANALKGAPKPLSLHSWHDLADVAAKVVAERDALRARIDGAMVVKATRNGIVRSEARMALIGKRVALVVIE